MGALILHVWRCTIKIRVFGLKGTKFFITASGVFRLTEVHTRSNILSRRRQQRVTQSRTDLTMTSFKTRMTRRQESRDSFASFEFVSREPVTSDEDEILSVKTRSKPHDESPPVRSLAELRATIYPPDPAYDISERPWLPGPQKAYMLLNAKLVDPRAGTVRCNTTLHLAGGKVVKVAPTTPGDITGDFYCAGQKVAKIDASKYFVCPGLIDCHVHLMAVHGSAVSVPTWPSEEQCVSDKMHRHCMARSLFPTRLPS